MDWTWLEWLHKRLYSRILWNMKLLLMEILPLLANSIQLPSIFLKKFNKNKILEKRHLRNKKFKLLLKNNSNYKLCTILNNLLKVLIQILYNFKYQHKTAINSIYLNLIIHRVRNKKIKENNHSLRNSNKGNLIQKINRRNLERVVMSLEEILLLSILLTNNQQNTSKNKSTIIW